MPSALPAFDSQTVASLRQGDEKALERIYRDSFAALVQDAASQIADAAAAPRVAENAILSVWRGRGKVQKPGDLEQFLRSAVREHAEREASRKGPQAAAESAGAATVDASWARVAALLRAPAASAADAERANITRHHAAAHIAGAGAPRSRMATFAMAGTVLGLALLGVWWADRASENAGVTVALRSPEAKELSSRPGQRGTVTISDDSKLTMGPETKVTVGIRFGDKFRALKIDGSVVLAAVAGATPYELRAGNAEISGAANAPFTVEVRNYSGEGLVTVRVKEGKADVKSDKSETKTLAAGEAVQIATDGSVQTPSAEALDQALGWASGTFAVSNMPLKDVLPRVKRFYELDMTVKDQAVLERPVTMSASVDSRKDVIAAIEKAAQVKFGYEQGKASLSDAAKK